MIQGDDASLNIQVDEQVGSTLVAEEVVADEENDMTVMDDDLLNFSDPESMPDDDIYDITGEDDTSESGSEENKPDEIASAENSTVIKIADPDPIPFPSMVSVQDLMAQKIWAQRQQPPPKPIHFT